MTPFPHRLICLPFCTRTLTRTRSTNFLDSPGRSWSRVNLKPHKPRQPCGTTTGTARAPLLKRYPLRSMLINPLGMVLKNTLAERRTFVLRTFNFVEIPNREGAKVFMSWANGRPPSLLTLLDEKAPSPFVKDFSASTPPAVATQLPPTKSLFLAKTGIILPQNRVSSSITITLKRPVKKKLANRLTSTRRWSSP